MTTMHVETAAPSAAIAMPMGDPCTLVIFGATGDLARRKLIPALYQFQGMGCLNTGCQILGTGRTALSDAEYRDRMREAVTTSMAEAVDEKQWRAFAERLRYRVGDPQTVGWHRELAEYLTARQQAGATANRLFYVATPPSVVPRVITGLKAAELGHNATGWSRIVLEKPFGHDIESAHELNRLVNDAFPEESVFRIDHYLGKEAVQNILVFRFGNSLFEPVWNRNYVDYVEITAAETLGVEQRAAFYEETGALRDMVANHLLQLLALAAMEPPRALDADAIRDAKVQLLRSIVPMSHDDIVRRTVRGQYGPGMIHGARVPGYRAEPRVSPSSTTETFAAVTFYIDNWRWDGVPFYVRTGKRLAERMTAIRVHFKRPPRALFSRIPGGQPEPDLITLRIQPGEGIQITFAAKEPGMEMRPVPVHAVFSYAAEFTSRLPDAYGTLLLDAMRGDATLFTRRDEVEAQWRVIAPIEEAWRRVPPPEFPNYAAGSEGPADARNLMHDTVHEWCVMRSMTAR